MFVLESTVPDSPLGPYRWKGFLDIQDGIDGSVFHWEGSAYLLWSQLETRSSSGAGDPLQQCNWVGRLQSDWTVDPDERVRLSCAEHAWESVGNHVNEGAQAVQRNGKLFVIYSASLTLSTAYCLGMLEFKVAWSRGVAEGGLWGGSREAAATPLGCHANRAEWLA